MTDDTHTPFEPHIPFEQGETALLVDRKKRRYLVQLATDKDFHCHAGVIPHSEIIGKSEGTELRTNKGSYFTALRPTLSEIVLKMPRGAQVIYPKDLGTILMTADILPGARVLEAGVGSGALSMTLLRAGATVIGYEKREDFQERAVSNVNKYCDPETAARFHTEVRDVYNGIDEIGIDRIVLDLPEPWNAVGPACEALRPGGILCAYTPSIVQATQLRERLEDSPFGMCDTIEVLHRGWYIEGAAVRPNHRMVAHTGFLTSARLLTPT